MTLERTLPAPRAWPRVAPLVAFAVAALAGVLFIGIRIVVPATQAPDEMAYWLAAQRLTHGQPLYVAMDPAAPELYRYAPWFAIAWIPLTLLPQSVAFLLWEALLLFSACYVVYRLASLGGPAAAVLAALALPLIGAVESGNVGTALVALLVWRRAGPVAVGIAGSLKVYPLLMCAGYVAERRWRDLIIAVGVAGLLWLPAIWFGLEHYSITPQHVSDSVWSYAPWAVIGLLGVVGGFALRGSRWSWLAAGAAVPLLVPHYVGITYCFVAAVRLADPLSDEEPRVRLAYRHRGSCPER